MKNLKLKPEDYFLGHTVVSREIDKEELKNIDSRSDFYTAFYIKIDKDNVYTINYFTNYSEN